MVQRLVLACAVIVCMCVSDCRTHTPPPPDYNRLVKEVFGPPNEDYDSMEECTCVPYYQCALNRTIIDAGDGIIDVRAKPACERSIDVCCFKTNARNPAPPTPPTVTQGTPPIIDNSSIDRQQPQWRGCGFRNENGVATRIKNDDVDGETLFGEFPWMAAILRDEQGVMIYQCGGSLIHPQVVITAAHCVIRRDLSQLIVRAGEWDTQEQSELISHQQIRVAKIITHPDFYSGGLYNDIALIVLQQPFSLAENINTICLPFQGTTFNDVNCVATGWGKDKYGSGGEYQFILRKVDLPMVPHQRCENELQKTRLGGKFKLHHSFVCAGGEVGKDTCKGDGGSPLVCPVPGTRDRYQQVGIVSWGIGCSSTTPGVYVNVAAFRDWINQQMNQLNLKTVAYSF